MANKKISELQSRTPALSDLMLVGDPSSGYSYKCTVTALATIIETDIADGYVTIGTTQTISGAKTFSNNLTLTSVANATTTQSKFLTLNASNVVNYRTGAEVLADIGGASSSSISGTTNYVAKFTSSSAIGNSQIFDNGTSVGINTATPNEKLEVSGVLRVSRTTSASAYLNLTIENGVAGFDARGSIDQVFYTGALERMRLTFGGNLGIGTSNPTTALDVNGVIKTNNNLELTSSTPTILWTTSNLRFYNNTNGIVATISSTGQLTLSSIPNATIDTDRFLVSDSGVIKYRTGSELLSDIGGQGTISLAAIGSTPNANGATLSSNTLTLQPASASFGGVLTTGFQEIAGWKRFTGNPIQFDNHLEIKNLNSWGVSWGYTSFASKDTPVFGFLRGHSSTGSVTYNAWFTYGTTGDRNYTLPSSDGTLALTSQVPTVSGTTNYIPKFTSSSAIGNSIMYEGTNAIGIGTNVPASYAGFTNLVINNTSGGNIDLNVNGTRTLAFTSTATENYVAGIANIPLLFLTNNTERMRLDASGNLLVATTSPSYNAAGRGNITIGGSSTSILSFQTGGTDRAYLYHDATNLNINNAANGALLFGTNNTERARIDASGNLGLGVSPSAWESGFTALQIGNGGGVYSANSQRNIYLVQNAYYNAGFKYVASDYAGIAGWEDGSYVWLNAPSGTAGSAISFTQAMTLDASGRLGIGVTNPATLLQLSYQSSATELMRLSVAYPDANAKGAIRWHDGAGTTAQIDNRYNGTVTSLNFGNFYDANQGGYTSSTVMSIMGNGRVGIGSTSPQRTLDVIGSSNDTPAASFGRGLPIGNWSGIHFGYSEAGNSSYRKSAIVFERTGNAAEGKIHILNNNTADISSASLADARLTITPSGNVGIGTTSPQSSLHIAGAIPESPTGDGVQMGIQSNYAVIHLNGTTGTGGLIDFSTSGVDFKGRIEYSNASDYMRFATNGAERMRITSGGDVGIGVTSPGAKLEVNGAIKTAAPSGGTAKPWKFGEAGVSVGGANTTAVKVEIDGVVYYLLTAYLPEPAPESAPKPKPEG